MAHNRGALPRRRLGAAKPAPSPVTSVSRSCTKSARRSKRVGLDAQDGRVLEFLLGIEYLQAAFYTEVDRRGALSGELREFARLVGEQERAHVAALERTLGGNPGKRPEFDFGDATANPDEFIPSAVELEEIAVGAYNGQVANLTRPRVMTAMKIVSVEARHVGWARDLAGRNPAPRPADPPATQAQVRRAMNDTGFVE